MADLLAVLALGVSGITLWVVMRKVESFGHYTERVERSDARVCQSNELTRQYLSRATDEVRANADITTQAHERNLILFRELSKFRHELKDIIDNQPKSATVQQVAADLGEYGSTESFIVILKDGKNYYLQVKSVDGDGGDPLNDSKVCPGSPGC